MEEKIDPELHNETYIYFEEGGTFPNLCNVG